MILLDTVLDKVITKEMFIPGIMIFALIALLAVIIYIKFIK